MDALDDILASLPDRGPVAWSGRDDPSAIDRDRLRAMVAVLRWAVDAPEATVERILAAAESRLEGDA